MLGSTEAMSTCEAAELLARGRRTLAGGRLGASRRLFFAAAQAAEQARLPDVRAEAAIGAGGLWLHELRIVDERAAFLALLHSALTGLGAVRPDLQLRLRIRLAAESAYDGTGSLDDVRALVDVARNEHDLVALGEGLSLLHHAMLTPQYAHERLPVADELVRVAATIDAPTQLVMGMCWRTIDLLLLGHGGAERALAELRMRAEEHDVLAVRYVVAEIDTMLSLRSGRFDDAEALAFAGHGLGVETGDADADASYLVQVLAIRWMQGRAGELLGEVEEVEHATTIVHTYAEYVWPVVAVLAAEAGQRDRTQAALDRVLAAGLESLPQSSAWLTALFCVAEAAAYLDDSEAAHEVARLLEPFEALPVVGSLGVVCFGAAARSLGIARRAMDDLDGSVRALEGAILQNRRLGHLPMLAITRADLARTLVRRDEPGDRARADELYETAMDAARRMGMAARAAVWLRECETLQRSETEDASIVRTAGHWEVTLGCERAIINDSVGMGYLTTLLARPHEDVSAAVLAGAVEEHEPQLVLDSRAREDYRRRIAELRREIDEADADADIERAAAGRAELDALIEELRRVVRPGGRSRAFTDADERARTSVQKALRRTLASLRRDAPRMADALERSIRTGAVCRFEPVDVPERWRVRVDQEGGPRRST